MDRNLVSSINRAVNIIVALRKESVDRNTSCTSIGRPKRLSLSARRAWIEIPAGCWRDARRAVALRKESVDRNSVPFRPASHLSVALRKESVDRNLYYGDDLTFADGRSPQGERG